jgi:aspartyl-tRNA(Asn)/glutamyl-tRNA(Gln) amidotransferase subunit C
MINTSTVKYIAELSRLHLNDPEILTLARDLESIIDYVRKLETLDVTNVKPTSHVLDVENVFRDDVLIPSLTQEQAMGFSIENLSGAYKVPKVIE